MKNETLIHIRLEYSEAVQSKKDVLLSEMNTLRIAKIIKKYNKLRSDELSTKIRLGKKIKDLKTSISQLETILPKIKIPSLLKKDEFEELEKSYKAEETIHKIKEKQKDQELEDQLTEIQKQLRALQA